MSKRVLSDSDASSASDKEAAPAPTFTAGASDSDADSDQPMPSAASAGGGGGEGGADSDKSDDSALAKNRARRTNTKKARVMESGSTDSDSGDSDWGTAGRKKKLTKKKNSPSNRNPSDDQEDGELSSNPEDSGSDVGKAANADDSDDSDDLYEDDEDKERLENMTEKEREQEIFKRLEKKEMLKARKRIEKKLKKEAGGGGGSPSKKRVPDIISASDRKTSLELRKEKTKSSLSNLLELRKAKMQKEEEKKKKVLDIDDVFGSDDEVDRPGGGAGGANKPSDSSSSSSDSDSTPRRARSSGSDSDSDSDLELAAKRQEIGAKEQLERCRISRFKLDKFVHAPFFSKTVCQIIDVVETGKVYTVEKATTNKGLKLRHGNQERVFRLAFVSNSPFTDSEFDKWVATMKANSHELPSIEHVERKEKDVRAALKYQYSNQDIDEMVREKNRFKKNPIKFAVTKTALMKERDGALDEGNQEEVDRLNWQISALDEQSTELQRRQDEGIKGISWINQKNKNKMKDAFLSANGPQVAEENNDKDNCFNRKNSKSRMVAGPAKPVTASAHPKSNPNSGMSMRLPVPPGLATGAAAPAYVPPSDAAVTTPAPNRPNIPPPPGKRPQLQPLPESKKADCLFDAHDFDININIALPNAGGGDSSLIRPPTKAPSLPIKTSRALNLEEYKRKRGLI